MDMRKYGGGFIKPDDLRDGPVQEKIVDVYIDEKYDQPVLVFESGDKLSLNGTNLRIMKRAYTWESKYWLDQIVGMSVGTYSYEDNKTGEKKSGETVALKPISARQPADGNGNAIALPLRRDDLNDEIPFE